MKIELFSIKIYLIYTTGTKAKCEIFEAYIAAVASWKASTKIRLQNRQYTSRTWTKFGLSQPEHSNNFHFIICIICNNIKTLRVPLSAEEKAIKSKDQSTFSLMYITGYYKRNTKLLLNAQMEPISAPVAHTHSGSLYRFTVSLLVQNYLKVPIFGDEI